MASKSLLLVLLLPVGLGLAGAAAGSAAPPPTAAPRVSAHIRPETRLAQIAEQPAPIVFGDPVAGYGVDSAFGLRRLPWEGHGRLHEGVDIAAPLGSTVTSTADGVVIYSGEEGGYGRMVAVQHANGLVSRYGHLGRIVKRAGDRVSGGDEIGRVGSTGLSTGPHLHFEIRDAADRPLNPQFFIGRQFASAAALPLQAAARISETVHIAQVSFIPFSKRPVSDGEGDTKAAAPTERPKDGPPIGPALGPAFKNEQQLQAALAAFRAKNPSLGGDAPRGGMLQ